MGVDMTGVPNVNAMAFPGDPGHEAGSQPMRSLKGSCSGVHAQPVDEGFQNSGSAVGNPSDTSGNITGWDNSVIHATGGSHGVPGNDSRTKST